MTPKNEIKNISKFLSFVLRHEPASIGLTLDDAGFVDSILSTGLTKRQRHHVHMSEDIGIARAVGQRYGAVVILEIDAKAMHAAGHEFYRSDNGVWPTDHVPTPYLKVRP